MGQRLSPEEFPLVYLNDACVYAIERETGRLMWSYDAQVRIVRMLLAYDCVYVLDMDCVVHCVRGKGELLGKVRAGSPEAQGAALLADEGYVFVATTEGVVALSPDGKKKWTFTSPTPATPTVLPGLALPDQVIQPDFRD
jgi:outer membrane protein assembly factor BamB